MTRPTALCDVRPAVGRERLLTDLVPPRHFEGASFASYVPDAAHPSQQAAVERLAHVAEQLMAPVRGLGALLRRRRVTPPAVYLDGGFGVGKTHLLAALANALGELDLVCIDEFELDDPGDTVLVSRLLRELADRDVALAATSNTLPDALGEGRFAAEDFLREIQALSARFEVLRVDGDDYRQRAVVTDAHPLPDHLLVAATAHRAGATCDFLDDLLAHLRTVHPSRYGALLDGVELVALRGVRTVDRQDDALRLVVLADRLYDRGVPVLLGGDERTALFTSQMLAGGYRKKYLRTLSRLGALAQEGRELVAAGTAGAPTSV